MAVTIRDPYAHSRELSIGKLNAEDPVAGAELNGCPDPQLVRPVSNGVQSQTAEGWAATDLGHFGPLEPRSEGSVQANELGAVALGVQADLVEGGFAVPGNDQGKGDEAAE